MKNDSHLFYQSRLPPRIWTRYSAYPLVHDYADMLEAQILAEGPETVMAFIVEAIGGAATGALVPPKGDMRRIRQICDRYGVLLIHDQVMTGGGRTGRFFGGDHFLVCPPMIVTPDQIDEIMDGLTISLVQLAAENNLPVSEST